MAGRQPRQRADAAENRRLILAAALEALSESSEVSLNSIAARARVAGLAACASPPGSAGPTVRR